MRCHDRSAISGPCCAPDPADDSPRPIRWARIRYRFQWHTLAKPAPWLQVCALHLHQRLDAADDGVLIEPTEMVLTT